MQVETLNTILFRHAGYLCGIKGGVRANLSEANLTGANLSGTNLTGTNLTGAYLSGANLSGTNLSGTNLTGAYLSGANLSGTVLDPKNMIPVLSNAEITEAGLEFNGEFIYGWRTKRSQHCGATIYKIGGEYVAPYFSTDVNTACHPGIYLASLDWLKHEYDDEFVRCYCRRDELVHAGDKWRCKRLWVITE